MSKVCGTGSGNFPQPGDPDLNNSLLSAVPAFGGIDVSWTYPLLNPEAVAHTLLYRSTNEDPATKVSYRTVTGDFYYDKSTTDAAVTYYYWVQHVSVNGTVGELIGPASAMARPTIEQVIQGLTGRINNSLLGQALKGDIHRIDSLTTTITSETATRLAQYELLQADLAAYQNHTDGVATLLANDVVRLKASDTSQINQINVLGAKTEDNSALIITESEARADAESAAALVIDTLQASSVNTFYQDTAPDPSAVTLIENDIWVDTTEPSDGSEPAYTLYQWDGSSWYIQTPNTLAGTHAAVESERLARVNRDGALAQTIDTVETSVGRKSRTFFQVNPPIAENVGDLWIDTDDKNRLHRWTGSAWEDVNTQTGLNVFRQSSQPVAENVGDMWFDSGDDDKGYRWDGSSWIGLNLYTGNQVAATIEDYNATRVGYCMVNGSPDSRVDSKALCEATSGGVWLDMYSIADAVKGVQIDDGEGGSGSVQQKMTSYRDALGDIQSMYTMKVQIDPNDSTQGIIKGGLGIGANESTGLVDAGFDVDTFWVGKLGQKTLPFIINGDTGETYIKEAVIQSLTINKLQAEDKSELAFEDGKLKAKFIDVDDIHIGGTSTFSGSLDVKSAPTGGRLEISGDRLEVYDGSNRLRVRVGRL